MGHVVVNTGPVMGEEVHVSNSAMKLVRLGFNPSQREDVAILKSLAAAFISACEEVRDRGGDGAREAALAITQAQTASMFAVAAATADL